MSRDETNPRGVSGEPDVETVTENDEGNVRFTTDGEEPRPKPSLDDGERTDPRVDDEGGGDEGVEIDLSEAAMADEASEATGPTPEQSYPAREGTDPEPTSEKAPERRGDEAVADTDRNAADRQADDENGAVEDESDR